MNNLMYNQNGCLEAFQIIIQQYIVAPNFQGYWETIEAINNDLICVQNNNSPLLKELNSKKLYDKVLKIDKFKKTLGFRYEAKLKQECKNIIQRIYDNPSDYSELNTPIINLQNNFESFECKMIFPALILCYMEFFISNNSGFLNLNWNHFILNFLNLSPKKLMNNYVLNPPQLIQEPYCNNVIDTTVVSDNCTDIEEDGYEDNEAKFGVEGGKEMYDEYEFLEKVLKGEVK
ncbi:hypothetical protein AAEX28_06850 [Lentisphaerota bacterium WC36G]|nr:hypothetical protein LJT99_09715 [Lentisphaerae bacterium WC36]